MQKTKHRIVLTKNDHKDSIYDIQKSTNRAIEWQSLLSRAFKENNEVEIDKKSIWFGQVVDV